MRKELEALDKALGNPVRKVLGIVGGAKVSTKLDLLNNLVGKLDYSSAHRATCGRWAPADPAAPRAVRPRSPRPASSSSSGCPSSTGAPAQSWD
jgi:hypothetical protein